MYFFVYFPPGKVFSPDLAMANQRFSRLPVIFNSPEYQFHTCRQSEISMRKKYNPISGGDKLLHRLLPLPGVEPGSLLQCQSQQHVYNNPLNNQATHIHSSGLELTFWSLQHVQFKFVVQIPS